jgi:hypothetical protein
VKVQLRNRIMLRCRRRPTSGRQHPGTTAIAKGVPGSPESLAQGMFPKGFPDTYEGGEPQGFRKEWPRYPLEGRGNKVTNLLKDT